MPRAPATRAIALAAAAVLLTAASGGQPRFRSSLTATVNLPTERETGESSRDDRGPSSASDASARFRCHRVTLRWGERSGARHYAVYVSVRGDGPWAPLPPRNVCGATIPAGSTGLVDVEPAGGAPTVARRLYYKVFALAGADAPLDVTDPVVVELP